MARFLGRKILFTWGGAAVEGVREKSVQLNGEAVDVTGDDDLGWRALLEEAGEDQVDISLSGVTKSDALKRDWFAKTRTKPVTVTYPDGGVLSGTFFLASYADTGPYNDATTFEAEIQSSGPVTYTPSDAD
jgi:TP901-1 family phage major tail protein